MKLNVAFIILRLAGLMHEETFGFQLCPTGHGGPHWDVQYPDGKTYNNVYPGGKIRPGRR